MKFKLVEIQTFVSDLGKSKEFYTDTLGFVLKQESDGWIIFDVGDLDFIIQSGAEPKFVNTKYGKQCSTMMVLATKDIEASLKELKSKGVEFLGEITTVPQGKFIGFKDPDGNLIELVQQNL